MLLRRLVFCAALLPVACREPAHIDMRLSLECDSQLDPAGCGAMLLDCANFLEVRLYQLQGGGPGNILRSRCIGMSDLGKPTNMCQLSSLHGPSLLTDLPEGETVLFRMRALFARAESAGCNDDIPGVPPPVVVFDGFSEALSIDGSSHLATIHINTCGNCLRLPPACTNMSCPPLMCPPGTTPVGSPNGPDCCAVHCEACETATNPNCTSSCSGVTCPTPPQICPDGSRPVQVAGRCCPECLPSPAGGSADAGVRGD